LVVVGAIVPFYSVFEVDDMMTSADVESMGWNHWWDGSKFSLKGYADALFAVFFTVDGWNNLNYSVEELKDPVRNLPKAVLGGTMISMFLFICANIAYFVVLPVPLILKSQQIVGADFFRAVFGPGAIDRISPLLITLSTIGAISCMTFGAARLILSIARENVPSSMASSKQEQTSAKLDMRSALASSFAYVSSSQTPVNAIILHFIITLLFIVFVPSDGAYKFLVEATGYASYVFYGLTVYGLLWLRLRKFTTTDNKFKVWWPAAVVFIFSATSLAVCSWLPGFVHEGVQFWVAPCVAVSTMVVGVIGWAVVGK